MTAPNAATMLRSLGPSIYGPTLLFSLGIYAMLPIVPVIAVGMGASLALSGFIVSAAVVGKLLGNLPASWLVSRSGERVAMLVSAGLACAGALGVAFAPASGSLGLLGAAMLLVGLSESAFGLARHSFMTLRVPFTFRARALSLIGGSHRFGRFAGPFAAAALLGLTGDNAAPLWMLVACLVLTVLLLLLAPDPEQRMPVIADTSAKEAPRAGGIVAAVRAGGVPLWKVGGSAAILAGLRSCKDLLLPLWAVSIGLDAQTVALVVGIAGAIDFALFYLSGQVMDRYGRLWAALPATASMAVSFLVLATSHDLPGAVWWLVGCAVVIGIGNGLSSGILLTLGADLAPRSDPAPYLAAWRTLTDLGGAAAPLLVSAVATVSLPAASALVGVLAVCGTLGFARWIPRYVEPRR